MVVLDPDPFQPHPNGPWTYVQFDTCIQVLLEGLMDLDAGRISEAEFRSQKDAGGRRLRSQPANALWLMHHPVGKTAWRYLGRPFWSVEAYRTWRELFLATPLGQRRRKGVPREITFPTRSRVSDPSDALVHEHVIPQSMMIDLLARERRRFIRKPRELYGLMLSNLDAVITKREDRRLPTADHPDTEQPWKRYADSGIQFIPNPAWSADARDALSRWNLIAPDPVAT